MNVRSRLRKMNERMFGTWTSPSTSVEVFSFSTSKLAMWRSDDVIVIHDSLKDCGIRRESTEPVGFESLDAEH